MASPAPCRFFSSGRCRYGADCRFSHAGGTLRSTVPCRYYLQGRCNFGERCRFAHEGVPQPSADYAPSIAQRMSGLALSDHVRKDPQTVSYGLRPAKGSEDAFDFDDSDDDDGFLDPDQLDMITQAMAADAMDRDVPLNGYGWTERQPPNEASRVEYYENRAGVKMDYFPTTGTVKTSLEHPVQGRTQMFRRDLTEAEFQAVAQDPRAHTSKGYQTRGGYQARGSSYRGDRGRGY